VGVRWLVAVAAVGTVFLSPMGPATAKLPPWTCELSTTRPVVHERVRIEVRFWEAPFGEYVPARWVRFRTIPFFLEARSDSSGGPGHPVRLASIHLVKPGVYEASLTFQDTSRYRVSGCRSVLHEHLRGDPTSGVLVRPLPLGRRGPTTPWAGSTGDGSPIVGILAGASLAAVTIAAVRRLCGGVRTAAGG
jgi:hypothetical protein